MKNDFLRTFFTYSKNQQRGIIVLSITLLSMIVYLSFDQYFYEAETEIDRSQELKEFIAGIEKKKNVETNKSNQKPFPKKEKKTKDKLRLKLFNPNSVSISELMDMGISNHIAKNFINYREKVGPFKNKEDIRNLYTVNDYLYSKLENFISIEESELIIKNESAVEEAAVLNLNINIADTTEFKKIKGIGSFFAKQIVKYRNGLGGFHSENQYKEVYRLGENEQSLKALIDNTFIDDESWNRINIDDLNEEELIGHPYFWGDFGKVFYNYCVQNGPFENVEDIKGCHLVTDEIYLKIAPYLKLN